MTDKKKSRLASAVKWLIVIGLFVAAALTCPNKAKHVKVISERVGAAVTPSGSGILGGLLNVTGRGVSKFYLENTLIVDDFFFFSVGRIKDSNGSSDIVSFGIFGHIITSSSEQIREGLLE